MGAATEITNAMSRNETAFDIDAVFCTNYGTVARIIARVVRDHARAEELAVEVLLRLWRDEKAQGYNVKGWLYRVAVRAGVDELRRRERRTRYESLFDLKIADVHSGLISRVATEKKIATLLEEGTKAGD